MPVLLTNNLHESGTPRSDVSLFAENGELSVAGDVVAHFLETADFSQVFEHPEAAPYIISVVNEENEDESEDILPGNVVLRLIDEDDLAGMFLHYLDILGENASAEDAPLEMKAKLAVFENALLKPINERFKKGAFRQMRKAKGGAELVNRMLGAMLQKGEIKRSGAGSGYRGGDYERTGRYGSAERKSTKQKRMRIRKQSAGKMKAARARTRGARGRARALAASVGMEESFLFGFGESYGDARFQVSTKPDAAVEFSEAELTDLRKTFAPCYDSMAKVAGRRGVKLAEKADEGRNDGKLDALHEDASLAPIGVASLSEGADIAGAVVGLLGGKSRKLDEAKR